MKFDKKLFTTTPIKMTTLGMTISHKKKHVSAAGQIELFNKISIPIQLIPKILFESYCLGQFLNVPRDFPFLVITGKSFQI